MSEHPAVSFLVAAHERAERLANASGGGKWSVVEMADCGCCDLVRNETGGLVTTADQDIAPLIAEHANPTAVLRRIAADRELLAEHALQLRERASFVLNQGAIPACSTCWGTSWPCRTVLALAAGWGWAAGT